MVRTTKGSTGLSGLGRSASTHTLSAQHAKLMLKQTNALPPVSQVPPRPLTPLPPRARSATPTPPRKVTVEPRYVPLIRWEQAGKLSLTNPAAKMSHWKLADPYQAHMRPKMTDEPISKEQQLLWAMNVTSGWSKQAEKQGGAKRQIVGAPSATNLILSDQLLQSKRHMPGLDGDFHSTSTNSGYGRTPYGGYYTSFK